MLERVGNEVSALERIRFGPLELGDLELGQARLLSRSELKRLWKDAGG
jgi:16S rRNA U516 pseudouridylate synthase RsuA-like enzyme